MLCELKKMDKNELMENKNIRIGVIVFAVIAGLATVAAAAYGMMFSKMKSNKSIFLSALI